MLLLYIITLFLSALLLFSVQPMVGKMVLPLLGGTPAVWNTCMVFFQAALLAGYAYAHASAARLGARRQAILHLVLLAAGLAVLPISFGRGESPPAQGNPILWLLSRLAVTAGIPFFVMAGTAPLLQRWFSGSTHRHARDPYFLYAASNAGSLLALLLYPVLVEPLLDLSGQSRVWLGGYVLLIVLTACCAVASWRGRAPASVTLNKSAATAASPVTWRQAAWWTVLAAVPSSLMLGVTLHITTNVAAMPLLWVLPLSLYLLTFVLAFARRQVLRPDLVSRLLLAIVLLLGPLFFIILPELEWRLTVAHLAMFFLAALVCHTRLAAGRPEPRYLTEYYLWIAVGGVLGGAFNALVAPLVFHAVVEYPLMVVAACLLRPVTGKCVDSVLNRRLDWLLPAGLAVVVVAAAFGLKASCGNEWTGLGILFALATGINLAFWRRRTRFALGYAAALVGFGLYARLVEGDVLCVDRNFFGVKKVVAMDQGKFQMLYNGTTIHGVERVGAAYVGEPLAYYHRGGPVGDLFRAFAGRGDTAEVGAVGLGAGAIAVYAQPRQKFTFYEIDPDIARIAQDPRYFRFLAESRGRCEVILGDGRLALGRAAPGQYGLIFLDAYSSDAIPTHLLSREAMQLYLAKLRDDGLLGFHITNRCMDLEPVVANLARDAGLVGRVRLETSAELTQEQQDNWYTPAEVAVFARRLEDLGELAHSPKWRPPAGNPSDRVWTDQYSDILGPLLSRLSGKQ